MKKTFYSSLLLAVAFSTTILASTSPKTVYSVPADKAEKIKDNFNKGEFSTSSFAFTENKGQVMGYDGLPHPEVKFSFQQGGTQIFLLEKSIAYQFTKMHYPEGYLEMMRDKAGLEDMEKLQDLQKQIRTESFRMDMTLVGANKNCEITTKGKSTDYINFYNRNVLDVHSYSQVTYHNVYPGIDWVIYTKGKEVKYDFVVKPGADPSRIKMRFDHQEGLKLNADGSITMENSLGSITEKAPESFQAGKTILTKFKLIENTLSFELGNYDAHKILIIDPILVWATYYGGSGGDIGESSSVDGFGNVYLAGYTSSGNAIASSGHQNSFGGFIDAFLVKYNGIGIRQWATYYGGIELDLGRSCTIDINGNVFLSGYTESSTNISLTGHQNVYGGNGDAFLVKFNSSGVRQWGTYYGSNGGDAGEFTKIDGTGNVYLVGATQSTVSISSGGHQNVYAGGSQDAFLVKFNNNGVRQWSTYYGGAGDESGFACSVDGSGNVFLVGNTTSTAGIAIGGHQNIFAGVGDAFLVKFNTSGIRQWGTYYGGSANDDGISCSTDGTGNVFITGTTSSTTNIAIGGHQNFISGMFDSFLIKFNSNGVRQWGTYYGGNGNDEGHSCTSDGLGNVFLVGVTGSSVGVAYSGHQNVYGGGLDAFLVKFNGNGERQSASYYGGSGEDRGYSVSTEISGNIYLAGYSWSTSGIASGGHQNINGGGNDAFLVKFCDTPNQPSVITGNTLVCFGAAQSYSVTNDLTATSYSWSVPGSWSGTSTTNIVSATAGATGILSVTANNACGASPARTINITSNPLPTVSVNSGSICQGNSFTITPSGANTYTIQGGNAVVSPNANANYTIMGTSAQGCVSQNFATSSVTVNLNPTVTVNSGSICQGASFTISPSGANTYTIQGGNAVVSPNSNASYTVMGTSSQGCVSQNFATSSVTVNLNPTITVNSGSICQGSSFTIAPSGANTYTIQGGNAVISPNANSSYTVLGTSAQGCVSQNFATASVTVYLNPTITVNSGAICFGESFTLVPSGASTYTNVGFGSNLVVSPTSNTSFTIIGSSAEGCVAGAPAIANVSVNALPVVTVNSGAICSGQSFTLNPGGASSYSYSGGSAVVSPNVNTSYTVTGTSAEGCQATAVSNVTVNPLPSISISGTVEVICSGESVNLTATGASSYTWSEGSTGSTISTTLNSTTTYSVIGTDANGCANNAQVTQNVDACLGTIQSAFDSQQLAVYPNPNTGTFFIESTQSLDVTIYNALGQLILQQRLTEGKNSIQLNEEAKGIYILQVNQSGRISNYKLVKE